jgi:hypothetical protein
MKAMIGWITLALFLAPLTASAHSRGYVHAHRGGPRVVVKTAPTTVIVRTPRKRRVVVQESTPEIETSPLSIGIRATGLGLEGSTLHLSDLENPVMGGLGVQLRTMLDEHWGLELAADFIGGGDERFSQVQVPLTMSAIFHILPESPIRPYALAGVGVQFTEMSYEDGAFIRSVTEGVGQIGMGVDVKLSKRLAFNADVRALGVLRDMGSRALITQDCADSIGGSSGVCSDIRTDDPFNAGIQFLAGVSYTF